MATAIGRMHFDTGVDLSAQEGAFPVLPPFPDFSGALLAAHMIGTDYAQYAQVEDAAGYGPGLDWSGNGHHIDTFGDLLNNVGAFGITAGVIANEPATSLTLAQAWATNSQFSMVCLAIVPAAAKSVFLIKSNADVTDPFVALTAVPQTADLRVQATGGGAAQTAQIGTLTNELSNIALYGGNYESGLRTAMSQRASDPVKTATSAVSVTALSGSQIFEFGDETGSGTGATIIYGLAWYNRVLLQAEFEAILIRQRTFHLAIGSALSI